MKLLCHIGTPKTASTLLQKTCQDNAGRLLKQGVLYPELLTSEANHITLMYASVNQPNAFTQGYGIKDQAELEAFRERMAARLTEVLSKAPRHVRTVLVSSENLTANMGRGGVEGFARLVKPLFDEIEILVYLRRQDENILSMYAEFMRKGFSNHSFDKFMDFAFDPKKGPPYLQYRRMLTQWRDLFGADHVTVRLFDKAHLRGGAILTDFLSHAMPEEAAAEIPASESGNVSLSAPALEFLRRIQPHVPFAPGGEVNPVRAALTPKINSLPTEPRPRMSPEQSERIMTHFAKDNDWLRKTFFPDLPEPLFAPRSAREDEETSSNLGKVSIRDFATFTGHLLT